MQPARCSRPDTGRQPLAGVVLVSRHLKRRSVERVSLETGYRGDAAKKLIPFKGWRVSRTTVIMNGGFIQVNQDMSDDTAAEKALVLGGGGVTGVAWEIGVLMGLADAGLDLSKAGLVVGTSAGAVVAAQLTSGVKSLPDLYAAQVAPPSGEIAARMGLGATFRFVATQVMPGSPEQARARLGRAALRARTLPEAERYEVIKSRMSSNVWPQRQRLLITSVNAETGEFVVFDKDSGVPLIDAVAASCAVPLVWPPVTINGRRYIDGGVRSVANVDLARGFKHVVVIAPIIQSLRRAYRPAAQIEALVREEKGVRAAMLSPDEASRAAIGSNVLDPAHRAASAQAGRAQGVTSVEQVREVWSS
jgi:NTE family protein